jgi:hypothetical protein
MPTQKTSGPHNSRQVIDELESLRQLAKTRRKQSFTLYRKRLQARWSPLEDSPDSVDAFPQAIAAE